ncbi:hypothetical protein SAMN05216359_12241 [Roseateles sp. YR242]|uniref:hypothetical protein n=1 Tax=Roseateles sp. YR242 TaxID=1855305 RepID=UPI0008B68918|nr:hypothetical protein [Roseateles sp. YR242]SEL89666.1 hypothetical protein SAMN05216359_12241 [Roseateles sp. YR242]
MKHHLLAPLCCGLVSLSGCSTVTYLMLENQTPAPVEVRYSSGAVHTVKPYAEGKEIFNVRCQVFTIQGINQTFDVWYPPPEYFESNIFSTTLNARVTVEGDLLIYSKKKPELPAILVPRGCGPQKEK